MIPEFALQLICGLSTVWCLAPRKQITSGYFRIQMLIVLGLSVLLFLTASQFTTKSSNPESHLNLLRGGAITFGLLAFSGSIAWTLERRTGGTIFAFAIAVASTIAILLTSLQPASNPYNTLLLTADNLTAAWLIGSVTAAMLLGHWYLTATGMSLAPFTQYNVFFLVTMTLRILITSACYFSLGAGSNPSWGLNILRWAGLIGPFIMGFLTIYILRYRNTQSATGVLYAATTLVFMGEMAARLIDQFQSIAQQQ